MNSLDLCYVVYNLVSNAVEACEKLDIGMQFIEVTVSCVNGSICICIKNPLPEDVDVLSLTSTKKDKDDHGLGIKSIKKIASKYGGEYKTRAVNGVFESIFTA